VDERLVLQLEVTSAMLMGIYMGENGVIYLSDNLVQLL
jgi:hypothetical protein